MPDSAPRATPSLILSLRFTGTEITAVRRTVTRHAADAGLAGGQLEDFVLAVNEIVTNAVVHGGGRGELRMWGTGHFVGCEVTDTGPGGVTETGAGTGPQHSPRGAHQQPGHGLRLARLLVDRLDVLESPTGTAVRLMAELPLRA